MPSPSSSVPDHISNMRNARRPSRLIRDELPSRASLPLIGYLALIVATSACRDAPTATEPPPIDLREYFAPHASLSSATVHASDDTPEQIFNDIATGMPSFAGFYLDEDGTPTVALTRAADTTAAKAVVLDRWSGMPGLDASRLHAVVVPHTFRQLAQWRDIISRRANASNVSVVWADERHNQVHIGVPDGADLNAVRAAMAALTQAPLSAVAVEHRNLHPTTTLQDSVRLTVPGLYITTWAGGCSIGLNVRKPSDFSEYMITASHCTELPFAPDGSHPQFWQASEQLGTEIADPAGVGSLYARPCDVIPSQPKCRYSDAAMYIYSSFGVSNFGEIPRTTYRDTAAAGSITLTGSGFRIVGEYPRSWLVSGTNVHKISAITGWTWGQITNSGTVVRYMGGASIQDYVTTNLFSGEGDSGGPVFVWFSGSGYGSYDAYIAGILSTGGDRNMGFTTIRGVHVDLGNFSVTNTPIAFPITSPGPGPNY